MASCQVTPAAAVAFVESFGALIAEAAGLPDGFPVYIDSDMAWGKDQFKDEDAYIHTLQPEDVAEIKNALASVKELGLEYHQVTKETFKLPTLGPKLDQIRHDVYNGKGFALIRGLSPRKYLSKDLTLITLGIQSYIANLSGRQDCEGNMLVHIIADKSSKVAEGHHRHSTNPITFHNEEAGDVVSWLTRGTAASAGRCIIASAHAVYNMLAADRPDLVRALAGSDWPFALPKFQCRPVLFHHDGRLIMNFGRTPLLGNATHPRPEALPKLSAKQIEALDAVEKLARATELEIKTQPGDLHFINNLAVLHRREGFENGPCHHQQRHLVRMRLRDEELGWAIPEELQEEWSKAFDEDKGDKKWLADPDFGVPIPLRQYPN